MNGVDSVGSGVVAEGTSLLVTRQQQSSNGSASEKRTETVGFLRKVCREFNHLLRYSGQSAQVGQEKRPAQTCDARRPQVVQCWWSSHEAINLPQPFPGSPEQGRVDEVAIDRCVQPS